MKKILIAIAGIFCFAVTSGFARTKNIIVDYEGKTLGNAIPNWVLQVSIGKNKPEIFPDNMENKEIFIASARESNLESAKSSANIDIINKILNIDNELKFNNKRFLTKMDIIMANTDGMSRLITYTYGNLPDSFKKTYTFWAKFNQVDDNKSIINTYYEYYLVYTIDKNIWYKILEESMIQSASSERPDIKLHYTENIPSSFAFQVYRNPNNKCELKTSEFFTPHDNKYYFTANKKGYDLDTLRHDTEFYDIRQNLNTFISDEILSKLLKKSYEVWFEVDLKDGTKPFIDYFVQWEIDKVDFLKYMKKTSDDTKVYTFTSEKN